MSHKLCLSVVVLSALVLWAPLVRAQNPDAGAQEPLPAKSPSAGPASAPREAASGAPMIEGQEVVADTTPLAGAQNCPLRDIASCCQVLVLLHRHK